jgi:CRP-like cAMP-binding protein
VSTLGEGAFFGEIAVLFESKRTASIRAKSYCDIFVLSKAALDKTLKTFPEQRALIKEVADTRVTKDALRNYLTTTPYFASVQVKESCILLLLTLR